MKRIKLTQGKYAIVDNLDYDYLNQFKWFAWKHGNGFYAARGLLINGKQFRIFMHKVIANLKKIIGIVDHINNNSLDNRRENLRPATTRQNVINSRLRKDNTSSFRGVNKYKKKWISQIQVNGKSIYLGYFADKKDAAKAYNKAAIKYFGDFAKLNIIK